MTTNRKNYGPFNTITRSIRASLKFGPATLKCEVQRGTTPMGRDYRMAPQWWIKFDKDPYASGPWSADLIRECYC